MDGTMKGCHHNLSAELTAKLLYIYQRLMYKQGLINGIVSAVGKGIS